MAKQQKSSYSKRQTAMVKQQKSGYTKRQTAMVKQQKSSYSKDRLPWRSNRNPVTAKDRLPWRSNRNPVTPKDRLPWWNNRYPVTANVTAVTHQHNSSHITGWLPWCGSAVHSLWLSCRLWHFWGRMPCSCLDVSQLKQRQTDTTSYINYTHQTHAATKHSFFVLGSKPRKLPTKTTVIPLSTHQPRLDKVLIFPHLPGEEDATCLMESNDSYNGNVSRQSSDSC